MKPQVLDALLAAGATAEMIVAAVKADQAEDEDRKASRRAKAAERQRKHRGGNVTPNNAPSRVTECDDALRGSRKEVSPAPLPETQLLTPPSPPMGALGSAGFDPFWSAYPRKTGKGAARKAWPKALAKVGGPDPPGLLLSALERVKRTWTDSKFIPHASTWLNEERWEDEPEPQVIPLDGRRDPPKSARRAAHEANMDRALRGAEAAARLSGTG
jgi:hypothetical protein